MPKEDQRQRTLLPTAEVENFVGQYYSLLQSFKDDTITGTALNINGFSL